MIAAWLLMACLEPEAPVPEWQGDTLTLTSIWIYDGEIDDDPLPPADDPPTSLPLDLEPMPSDEGMP